MIAEKMKNMVANSSAIRAMFEEGNRMAELYGAENVYDFSLGNPNVPAPEAVKNAIIELVSESDPVVLHGYTNSNSGYADVRETVATSLNERFGTNFSGNNIVMTVGAAGGLNVILKSLINPGDEVIAFAPYFGEYRSYTNNYDGVLVEISPNTENFQPKLDEFEQKITPKTKAIVCTNGSNLTGNYVDVAAVGEMAHRHGVLLIVDASQTAGGFPIDVQKMNIDVLCFTGHKGLLAPQGTGGLYVREGLTVQPLLSGGSGVQTYNKKHPVEMPTALEAGTLNGHGIAGMNAALAYLEETGIDTIREREQELMWKFYEGVKDIPNVTVYGDFSTKNR